MRTLKMADAIELTGYSRNQLRGLLRDLPSFITSFNEGRNKRFSHQELLTIFVIALLEEKYGMRRSAIGRIVEQLKVSLRFPANVATDSYLEIAIFENRVSVSSSSTSFPDGVILPLAAIYKNYNSYLTGERLDSQFELKFNPVAM